MSEEPSQSDPIGEIVGSFVERCRKGERPSVAEYAQAHPELADELREVLPMALALEEARNSRASPTGDPNSRETDWSSSN